MIVKMRGVTTRAVLRNARAFNLGVAAMLEVTYID